MGSHSVTCHLIQVNTPSLNPNQTGRYSIYLPQWDERLSWPGHYSNLSRNDMRYRSDSVLLKKVGQTKRFEDASPPRPNTRSCTSCQILIDLQHRRHSVVSHTRHSVVSHTAQCHITHHTGSYHTHASVVSYTALCCVHPIWHSVTLFSSTSTQR